MSLSYEPNDKSNRTGPSAPADDIYVSPAHSKSVTSMASLRSPNKNKRMSRQNSRLDGQMVANAKKGDAIYSKSTPVSPQDPVMISSNNSSSTSLASHVIKPTLSQIGLNSRPPSVYYSRDFLSSLAPREGGYAIAATMGNGLGAVGTMSVEERRRSGISTDERPRSNARAPVSRSAGMGRWSLDGGEVSQSILVRLELINSTTVDLMATLPTLLLLPVSGGLHLIPPRISHLRRMKNRREGLTCLKERLHLLQFLRHPKAHPHLRWSKRACPSIHLH